jgi:hypothetical protein
MDIETTENGDVVIKADETATVEGTVETVLEAATEIAEQINEARKEGEQAGEHAEQVVALAAVTLDTLNARFDGLESRLSALFAICEDIQTSQIITETVQGELIGEIIDPAPVLDDTPSAPTEISVEENNGEIKVEEVTAAVVPEIRPSKKARFI